MKNCTDTPALNKSGISQLVSTPIKNFLKVIDQSKFQGNLHQIILEEVEKTLFTEVLKFTHRNQIKASQILGINRNTLKRKIDQYGIKVTAL